MKLEQQVVSLELAQKLKELGVKQESLFWWHTDKAFIGDDHMYVVSYGKTTNPFAIDMYSAFTVAELGEMLPKQYRSWKSGDDKEWICDTWASTVQRAETEADARAKMLVYLLENNLITL